MNTLRALGVRARAAVLLATLSLSAGAAGIARGEEGMWLPNKPPMDLLKKHGFAPTPQWLEHQQKSAVRFNNGGSGSFVSADGLVMTNHHVGSEMIAQLSAPGKDLLATGFLARTRAEELKCPELELNVLWSIEDVTERVTAAAAGKPVAEANVARRTEMARIEKEQEDATGLDCQVVTLYQGGAYHLYRFKRFTDVRLVFAPDEQMASFGGDVDNFEFPRHCLDVSFFRVYEDGQPYKPEHHLAWSKNGSKEGDLALVFGHPGRTNRLFTADHMAFQRDVALPYSLDRSARREIELQTFTTRSEEFNRIGKDDLHGVANQRKSRTGELQALLNPALFEARRAYDQRLHDRLNAPDASMCPWDRIAVAQDTHREIFYQRSAIGALVGGGLAGAAHTIYQLSAELPKPSTERLREFRDTALPSLYLGLYSDAPIYPELEADRLASALTNFARIYGGDHPMVLRALAGQSPVERAAALIRGSRLMKIDERKRLVEGGASAVASSDDALIRFVADFDQEYRSLRKRFEDEVQAIETAAYAEIAKVKFEAEGDSVYPDATFTLRMSFGPIVGYSEGGKSVPAYTTMGGVFQRSTDRGAEKPFGLDPRWSERKGTLNLSTPYNFVSTCDIIGGNSGSPTVNSAGELIGIIFDGNIQSLIARYAYDDTVARAVSVDSRGIIEAMRKIYDAGFLADEIQGSGH
ncbi:MAG TPA: serine protease [Phycisphaerales bacterium]|nr:serine protease [Phycisphaerales bacterium]